MTDLDAIARALEPLARVGDMAAFVLSVTFGALLLFIAVIIIAAALRLAIITAWRRVRARSR